MSGQHTQGRLHVSHHNDCDIVAADGSFVATTNHVAAPWFPANDARRLAACWNACVGFETETLESADLHESAYAAEGREFDLIRERDQLRAELERTQRELAAARALIARDLEQELGHEAGMVEMAGRALVDVARDLGVVLTITQRPRLPLAMGNYETVVSVRPARGRA